MPRFLISKRSGVHRIACFALYRALLSQCASIPLPDEQRTVLWRLVRSRFQKHKNVQSSRLITVALNAGYAALDMLDAAVDGDEASTLSVSKLITEATTAKDRKRPPVLRDTGSVVEATKKGQQGPLRKSHPFRRPAPYPGATRVLDARPRLLLPGPRHIPKLVAATGVPFLRFKKPQSPFLGRVLRDKLNQRINYFNQLRAMEEQHEMALSEDIWDKVLYQTHGLAAGPVVGEMTWEEGIDCSLKDISIKLKRLEQRTVDTAQRMQTIVDEEKELARKERIQKSLNGKSRRRGSTITVRRVISVAA